MDPINMLLKHALLEEILDNHNPYIVLETLYLRIFKKLEKSFNISVLPLKNTELFVSIHDEVLNAYNLQKKSFSMDEKTCIERVLGKDAPHTNELLKFGTIWMKHDSYLAYRWFAVDGTLGNSIKFYIQESFNPNYETHTSAVRYLYKYFESPEMIKKVVEIALELGSEEEQQDQLIVDCIETYKDLMGLSELNKMKMERQQRGNKRKRETESE